MGGLFYFFVPRILMTRCRERQKNGHNERRMESSQSTQKTKDRWGIIGLPLVFQPQLHAQEVPYTSCLLDASGPVNNGFTSHFVWVSSAPNAALRKPALADVCHSQQVNVAFLMKIWVHRCLLKDLFSLCYGEFQTLIKAARIKSPSCPPSGFRDFQLVPPCASATHSRLLIPVSSGTNPRRIIVSVNMSLRGSKR